MLSKILNSVIFCSDCVIDLVRAIPKFFDTSPILISEKARRFLDNIPLETQEDIRMFLRFKKCKDIDSDPEIRDYYEKYSSEDYRKD